MKENEESTNCFEEYMDRVRDLSLDEKLELIISKLTDIEQNIDFLMEMI